ncbi:YoaK family protein [Polymorphobacter sp.]|uniref:YoaK family protein n=1 Tax=Polymorphobacter sp. TaxID=1909290 RepID=UPI003F6EB965
MQDRRARIFAAILSGTAGYIDAVGWLTSGGLFVSFMSGNVTKLGLSLSGQLEAAALGAGLISAFVGGVVIGSLVGRAAGPRQPRRVLALVTMILAAATACLESGLLVPAVLGLAAAMGAKNTVFAEKGEVKIGLTYMTGALVRMGKRIATALTGGDRYSWLEPLALFSSMLSGAFLGAMAQAGLGARAMWVATLVSLALTLYARRLQTPDR